jgi:hypothetical protein
MYNNSKFLDSYSSFSFFNEANKIILTLLFLIFVFSVFGQAQNFENRTIESGVIHSYPEGLYGAGISSVDFNLDGLDDLTFPTKDSIIFFYLNTGDSFEQVELIPQEFGEIKSICWVDFDNDLDLDLSFTEYEGSFYLFENTGNLEFIDITDQALLTNLSCENFGHSWVDVNTDGYLDVYINRYFTCRFCLDTTTHNLLFINNGDGTFTERAEEYGISDGNKMSFQSSFFDYDKDGLIDLHIINDRQYENSLYRNTGDGFFENVSASTEINLTENAMSNTILDFNNDGYSDIYFTNSQTFSNYLLKYNPEQGLYEDITPNSGAEGNGLFNWGAVAIDVDNDRLIDLAVSTSKATEGAYTNKIYRNNGGAFYDYPGGLDSSNVGSYGAVKGDFNNDGFYDLVFLNESPGFTEVYINTIDNSKKWLKVNFSGSCTNFFGVGVEYKYHINGVPTVNTVFAGTNYLSQESYTHILGLGNENNIDSLEIKWPSGLAEKHYNLAPFETHSFKEGQTYNTSISSEAPLQICPGEEVEVSTDSNYAYTLWNTGLNASSLTIETPGKFHAVLEIEPNVFVCSDTVVVSYKDDITLNSIVSENPTCFEYSDGVIEITHLDVFGNEVQTNYTNLSDGLISVVISDDYYCSTSIIVELSSPPPLFSYAETITLPCHSSDEGEVELFSIGGTAPYVYSIEDLSTIPFGTNTLTTVDTNGCIYPFDFYLDLAPTINIELEITDQIVADMGSVEILNNSEVTLIDILNEQNISQQPDSLSAGNYTITYSDENGCEYSEVFFIAAINSIGESLIGESIELYPNPCTTALHIKSSHSNLSISIYSAQGEELMSEKEFPTSTNSLDLTELSSGIYFIQIKKNQEIFTKKIIKN